jgi:hypothetical protein
MILLIEAKFLRKKNSLNETYLWKNTPSEVREEIDGKAGGSEEILTIAYYK